MLSHGYVQWAWKQDQVTATQKLVLLAIACQSDDHGRTYARRSTIAERCGIHKSGLSRHLKNLSDAGLILVHEDGPINLLVDETELQYCNRELQNRNATVAKSHEPSSSGTASGTTTSPKPPPWGELPEGIDTPEVVAELEDYDRHRRQKRSAMTKVAWGRLVAKLNRWGPERAVAALRWSMDKGWTGVFEENGNGKHQSPGPGSGIDLSIAERPKVSAARKAACQWFLDRQDELDIEEEALWERVTEGEVAGDEEIRREFHRVTGEELPA